MFGWNDDWRKELESENDSCFTRLCECRNNKSDIIIIANLMHEYNENKTAEECLDRTFEWLCSWNNQWELEPTHEGYKIILSKIK